MAIRKADQVAVALVRLHGEAIDVLGLEITNDDRLDPNSDFFIRRSLVRHPASLEVPRQDTGTHLVHPQRSRHEREYPSMMYR